MGRLMPRLTPLSFTPTPGDTPDTPMPPPPTVPGATTPTESMASARLRLRPTPLFSTDLTAMLPPSTPATPLATPATPTPPSTPTDSSTKLRSFIMWTNDQDDSYRRLLPDQKKRMLPIIQI